MRQRTGPYGTACKRIAGRVLCAAFPEMEASTLTNTYMCRFHCHGHIFKVEFKGTRSVCGCHGGNKTVSYTGAPGQDKAWSNVTFIFALSECSSTASPLRTPRLGCRLARRLQLRALISAAHAVPQVQVRSPVACSSPTAPCNPATSVW
jgi:hypothetical protein